MAGAFAAGFRTVCLDTKARAPLSLRQSLSRWQVPHLLRLAASPKPEGPSAAANGTSGAVSESNQCPTKRPCHTKAVKPQLAT